MTRAARVSSARRIAIVAVSLSGLHAAAVHAQAWSSDNNVESGVEVNDNYGLSAAGRSTVGTVSVTDTLALARRTESEATRIDAAATAYNTWGGLRQRRLDARYALAQSWSDEMDALDAALNQSQGSTYDRSPGTSDLSLSRGRRRTRGASAGWSRQLGERASSQFQWSREHTSYGSEVESASNFSDQTVGATLSYRLEERDSTSLQWTESTFRTDDGTNRSVTDSVSLGTTHSWSERGSASLNLGRYRTESRVKATGLVCPLQIELCRAGLVAFTSVDRSTASSRSGLQYSASLQYRWDEITEVSAAVSRRQSPSGTGAVVLADGWSASVSRQFSPTLRGSAAVARSRSRQTGIANAADTALESANVAASLALAPDLNLSGGYVFTRLTDARAGTAAHSNAVNLRLQWQWPRSAAGH